MKEEHPTESSSDSLYLKQLKFQEKDGSTWLNFFIHNFRVTVLIIIFLIILGVYSFNILPLESNPEVEIPFGVVTVVLPGASPSDIEELIIDKIEPKISNISGVKQVTSTAANSFGSVSVEFNADEDLKDAIRRLREAVESVRVELPEEANDPIVSEVSFSNTPVWTVVITGPYNNFTLRKYAEIVKDDLEKLPGTSHVLISGGDEYEIRVSLDPEKLQSYGLSLQQVNEAIKAANFALPLGTVEISNFEYTVRADGKFSTVEELRGLPLAAGNGQIVKLQDVATVIEAAKERSSYSIFSINGENPHNAVTLDIVKKTGSSILDLIDHGKDRIEILKADNFPRDLTVATTLDISELIRKDYTQLKHDGALTILLVTIILFLFVGLKEAFVAGLAVPLVFCATFGLMVVTGITLNFLSIFSLILSLGLLVDDAIVVVQATKQYLKTGKFTPEEAVLLVFHDYKVLLATTTLTTIWAFIPLLLATGIIGEFIRSIPITVSVTLAASFVIAIIINHPMAIILERFRVTKTMFRMVLLGLTAVFIGLVAAVAKTGGANIALIVALALMGTLLFVTINWYRKSLRLQLARNEELILEELADPEKIKAKIRHHYSEDSNRKLSVRLITGVIRVEKILSYYGKVLDRILASRAKSWLFLIVVFVLFAISIALPTAGILKSEFLPPADSEYLYINVEGAEGLILSKTREVTDKIIPILQGEKTIKSFSLVLGSAGINLSDGGASSGGGGSASGQGNKAQFAINFHPLKERPVGGSEGKVEKSYEIAPRLRKAIAPIGGAKITVVELAGGPPTGADIEAQISGSDLRELERQANIYKNILAEVPGTINEKTSITLNPGEFTLTLSPEQLQLHETSASQVIGTLRTAITGSEITKILKNGEELEVRSEFEEGKIENLNKITSLLLSNDRGEIFKLGDVASVSIGSSLTSISHIDEKRTVVISAGVERPNLPAEVLAKFQQDIKESPLPKGYEVKFGGQNDSNTESILSILRAMIVAMVLIIGTLVVQFNSFTKSVLVLGTIPLALIGVFMGLTLGGFTLSFPSLIGILALFGIVVKNAVILVDKINLNLSVGIAFREAIVDASKSRMEAIFLTSICTMIGMVPVTVSSETWQGLGLALIFGLITSTFLTLFVIPILFNIFAARASRRAVKLKELERFSRRNESV